MKLENLKECQYFLNLIHHTAEYVPTIMHTVHVFLSLVQVNYTHLSVLFHWHWDNFTSVQSTTEVTLSNMGK